MGRPRGRPRRAYVLAQMACAVSLQFPPDTFLRDELLVADVPLTNSRPGSALAQTAYDVIDQLPE